MKRKLSILTVLLAALLVFRAAFALDANKYHGGSYDGYDRAASDGYYELSGITPAKYTGGSYDGHDLAASDGYYRVDGITLAKYTGGSYDGHEMGTSAPDISLPVVLSSFAATAGDGQVTLHWVTESEVDNLGFHVYRAPSEDGEYERLTAELIAGAGTATSRGEYAFTDVRLTNGVTYYYKLEDVAFDGTRSMHGPIAVRPQAEEAVEVQVLPREFGLSQNVPNPFNPRTTIRYQLPEEAEVRLVVYDLLGQEVCILREGVHQAGYYAVCWDGRDRRGRSAASGVYVVRMEAGDFIEAKKVVLMR